MIILKFIFYKRNNKYVFYLKESKLKKDGTYLIIDLNEKIYYIINDKKYIPIENYDELLNFIEAKGVECLSL